MAECEQEAHLLECCLFAGSWLPFLSPCLTVPLSSRRTGLGPGALFLREVPGALRHPSSAHAPGWTHAAASPSLCQHHVQFHGHVEVSGLLSPAGVMLGPVEEPWLGQLKRAWATILSLPLTEAAMGTSVSSSQRMTS